MPVILPKDDFFLGCFGTLPSYKSECYELCCPTKRPQKTFFHLSINLEKCKRRKILVILCKSVFLLPVVGSAKRERPEKQRKQFPKSKGRILNLKLKKKLPSNFFYNRLGIFSEILPPYKEVLIDEILRLINNNVETNKLKQPDLILLQVLSLTNL